MTNFCTLYADVPVITFEKRSLESPLSKQMARAEQDIAKCRVGGAVIDMTALHQIKDAEMSEILEMALRLSALVKLAFVADEAQQKQFDTHGVAALFSTHSSFELAMESADIRRHALARTTVFIYAAGPSPQLDQILAGRPACHPQFPGLTPLERCVMDVAAMGPRNLIVHLAQSATEICTRLRQLVSPDTNLQIVADGTVHHGHWHAGAAEFLPALLGAYNAGFGWGGDVLAIDAGMLISGDLVKFVANHKANRAKLSVPKNHGTPPVFALSESALAYLTSRDGVDNLAQLPDRIATAEGDAKYFEFDGISFINACSATGHFDLWCDLLQSGQELVAGYKRTSQNIIAHDSARIEAIIPPYTGLVVGPQSVVERGANLGGTVIIGGGCHVCSGSYTADSILTYGTQVLSGAWVSDMFIGPNWAYSFRPEPTLPLNLSPAEYVTWAEEQPAIAQDDLALLRTA